MYQSEVPLLKTVEEDNGAVMDRKQLVNELVDYNLLLLRKIYDAYEERGDKVLQNFRTDKNSVLRKRYMVPIINPNYDYEKLLEEMKKRGKAKEYVEEDEEQLDGVTVQGETEQQVMEAVRQEAEDDLNPKKVEREPIDRFGNPVDKEKKRQGVQKATPLPFFERVEAHAEENLKEDDEEGRQRELLRKEMEELMRKMRDGTICKEELERLMELMKQLGNQLSEEDKKKLREMQDKFGLLT